MGADHFDIVLIGGGHAHLGVLEDWIRNGPPTSTCALLTPSRFARYSGTVPAILARQHSADHGRIDLAGLCDAAQITLIEDRCEQMKPSERIIHTAGGDLLGFEFASIDTGSVGNAQRVLGDDPRILEIRPIESFLERIDDALDRLKAHPFNIAVIGGGAGGVELSFALKHRLRRFDGSKITLIAGKGGVCPDFHSSPRKIIARELRKQQIEVINFDAKLDGGALVAGETSLEPVHIIIAAMGSAAPEWPKASALAVDSKGYILVDQFQRSVSHASIFAAGDVASRNDRNVPKSGVHAVHTGPVLAKNLRMAASGRANFQSYRPRPASLYLLSTGDERAIAVYGPLAAQGRWAARLKSKIDGAWLEKFSKLSGDL